MADASAIDLLAVRAAARKLPPPAERRAIRRRARVSAAEVAAACGVTVLSVHNWERGTTTPNAAHAEAYARLLSELARVAR